MGRVAAVLLKGRYYPGFTRLSAIDKMAAIDALLQLMKDLRDPDNGCPWDIRQTSLSVAPHTLDETHELLDAIERDDSENIREELGDLLFNIVFHARIAEEKGQFDFDDLAQGIVDKMVRRHPHVFGEDKDKAHSEESLARQWQAIKNEEKNDSPDRPQALDSASSSAMFRARHLQQQAARLGFDWPDIRPVMEKLDEEVAELRQAVEQGDVDEISDELGDILFVCVNIARHKRINAEMALRLSNQKFMRRFEYVQARMAEAGIDMDQSMLAKMEQFWQESKQFVG